METYEKVHPQVSVCLFNGEMFIVKPPNGGRSITVRNILVQVGYFTLSGTHGRSHRDRQIHHGFRRVEELPQMPLPVQQEVKRLLALLQSQQVIDSTDQLKEVLKAG